ncbi:MAG: glycosyltransferase family 4 protein, partial [Desulfobulbaceae bacterium]|nr:glycosyltransferase family 4 protein [Desulfobulbaceae bacterium]
GYGMFGPSKDSYEGILVRRLPIISRGKGQGWRLLLNYLSFVVSGCLLGPLYCKGRFDLILVYEPSPVTVGLPALVLKKLTGAPIFFWVQDLWPETLAAVGAVKSRLILNLIGSLVKFIYNGCDLLLVQSRSFVQAVKEYGVGEEKIRYFPNTAEALYRPIGTPTLVLEGDKLPGSFRIMFAGNIGAAQDFATILDAAERLRNIPEIHWVILGDGRLRPWVAEQVEKRGLQSTVHLLGRHPKEKMPDFFAQADALLVTLKKEEIFALTIPSKVQAYLACGRPVIAALEGEGQRVIEEAGAGLVVEPENPEKLAEAVQTMYNIPKSEQKEMGARGRDYFNDHFDRTKLFEKLEGWMQEICSMDVSKEKQQ